jgi:hypothetical protein
MQKTPKRLEQAIKRLNREIDEIEAAIYAPSDKEPVRVAALLERKRDDIVRSAVLQLHTKIEDLLTSLMLYCALGITDKKLKHRLSSERGKAFRRMLYDRESLGFDTKLNFAVGLGLISPTGRKQLMELNTMRNKCSHNWILNRAVRRGKRPKQLKAPIAPLSRQRPSQGGRTQRIYFGVHGRLSSSVCQVGAVEGFKKHARNATVHGSSATYRMI